MGKTLSIIWIILFILNRNGLILGRFLLIGVKKLIESISFCELFAFNYFYWIIFWVTEKLHRFKVLRRGYVISSISLGTNSMRFVKRFNEVRPENSDIHLGISLMQLFGREMNVILSLYFLRSLGNAVSELCEN